MTQTDIGGRFANDKVEFFGLEEINSLIAAGHRVTGMCGKGAILNSFPHPQTGEKMWGLTGFEIIVTLASPDDA